MPRLGPRQRLEVADIFRVHGPAWRQARAGHLSLGQLKVMSATRLREARFGGRRKVESCRTAALGGHVARCEDCAHTHIAYNSCRNRHCPKCQGAAAKDLPARSRGSASAKAGWLAARQAELLPVARLVPAGDGLDPTKRLLDASARPLALAIAAIASGGPPVDSQATLRGVLCDVRGRVQGAHLGHEVGDIVLTGSMVATKWLRPGDETSTTVDGRGKARLRIG